MCGFEERQARQFCRKCGGDLRQVLTAIQNADAAASGRDEIYRAFASKIKESKAKDVRDLVEHALPKLERLFESPQQKRVREIRAGITWAAAGIGLALFFLLRHLYGSPGRPAENLFEAAALVTIASGLGYLISTWLFSPPASLPTGISQMRDTNGFQSLPSSHHVVHEPPMPLSSVTENTTRELERGRSESDASPR
jgi:hypothetical protein